MLRFGHHYHGWFDNVLGGVVDPNPKGKPYPLESESILEDLSYTQGKWPTAYQESLVIPWNDFERLEETVKLYGDEIAMIHFESVVCNNGNQMPKPGFLEKIRELCTKHNIVMSMDEVITGFRVGLNGAQGYFGITPDIATFGKAIAGGVPMSAVAGKKDIMKLLSERKVLGPGTHNGYPLGMRATLSTLKILEKDDGAVYKQVARVQKNLETGLLDTSKKHGVPLKIQSVPGCMFTLFGMEDSDKVIYTDEDMAGFDVNKTIEFQAKLQEEGIMIMIGGRWYMNIAHTDDDVDKVIAASDKVMATMK
jgi:glutamate-1-semialdehyde 2,1-aminomutase